MTRRLECIEQAQIEAENMLNAELLRGALDMAREIAGEKLAVRERDLKKDEGDLKEKEEQILQVKVTGNLFFSLPHTPQMLYLSLVPLCVCVGLFPAL